MAALMDMSDRKLTDLVSMGLAVQGPTNRQFDALKTIHNYIGHLRKQAAGRATSNGMNLSDVRAEREAVEKEISEVKLARLRDEVLLVSEVSEAWSAFAGKVRQAFLAMPGKMRATIPHMTAHDAETVKRLCRDELKDLANEVEDTVIGGDRKDIESGKRRR
jgi:phage terminase Nu1 subunit (DNA packaging protein)